MTERRSIAVVGAGILGVSTSFFLRKLGHDVTMIERETGPCLRASFANAGALSLYDALS